MFLKRLQIFTVLIVIFCGSINTSNLQSENSSRNCGPESTNWNYKVDPDETEVIKFITNIDLELDRSNSSSVLIVLGFPFESARLKNVLQFPTGFQTNLFDADNVSPYVANVKLKRNESLVVFSPDVNNWTLVDKTQLSYVLSRINQTRTLIVINGSVPNHHSDQANNTIHRLTTLFGRSDKVSQKSIGLVFLNDPRDSYHSTRKARSYLNYIINTVSKNDSEKAVSHRPTQKCQIMRIHFHYTINVFGRKLRKFLLHLQPVELELDYKLLKYFAGNCSWEQKLEQLSNKFQIEVPPKVVQLIESIQSHFENTTIDNLLNGNIRQKYLFDINSTCEHLTKLSEKDHRSNIYEAINTLTTLFRYNLSGEFDPDQINALMIAVKFLQSRELPLDTQWTSSLVNFSNSCNQINMILTFLSSIESSLDDVKIKDKLFLIPASTVTQKSILNFMESVGLARVTPELRTAFDIHSRHLDVLLNLVKRHTKHKNCGEQLPVFPEYENDFQRFLKFVVEIESELKTWKPTSLLIVLGFNAENITRILKYPEFPQTLDETPYGTMINSTAGKEAILVHPVVPGVRSLFYKSVQLSYLMSRVNQSRLLIAPGTLIPQHFDPYVCLTIEHITRSLRSKSLDNSVSIVYQSELNPPPEGHNRSQKRVGSMTLTKPCFIQTLSQLHLSEPLPVLMMNSQLLDNNTGNVYADKLHTFIGNLQPLELHFREPNGFLGDCTWDEKLDEISNFLQSEISLSLAKLINSMRSSVRNNQATNTSNVLPWKGMCERFLNVTSEASSENILELISKASSVFQFNPYQLVHYYPNEMEDNRDIVPDFFRFHGSIPDPRWTESIRNISVLCKLKK